MISAVCGNSGFGPWAAASSGSIFVNMSESCQSSVGGSDAEDEGQGDTDDRQHLGDTEADPSDRLELGLSLGLPRSAIDHGGEDQTNTDARADRSEAVAQNGDVAG